MLNTDSGGRVVWTKGVSPQGQQNPRSQTGRSHDGQGLEKAGRAKACSSHCTLSVSLVMWAKVVSQQDQKPDEAGGEKVKKLPISTYTGSSSSQKNV